MNANEYDYPVFGICGYSNSGKTTVIVEVVRRLCARGLTVGVIKHDTHGINIDHEGKDTDRIYKAGADVLIRDPGQTFLRLHARGEASLCETLLTMGPYFDLILVEGHKGTPLDMKIWLCDESDAPPPAEAVNIRRALGRDEDRVRIVMDMIDELLPVAWRAAPLYAGILIGGQSSRMGRPKQLLPAGDRTWLEQTIATVQPCVDGVVLLGNGALPEPRPAVPVLPDVVDVRGPLAGIRAAIRWQPAACWVILSCDLPMLTANAVGWLLGHRAPGVWAVLPRQPEASRPEPLFAYYDVRMRRRLETVSRPVDIATADRAITPTVPASLRQAWTNINTPGELKQNL